MDLHIVEPIHTYFAASNRNDASYISSCFTDDAIVFDESSTHKGHSEIQSWFKEAREKYEYRAEPISSSADRDKTIVLAKVIGNFPGSPIQLHYSFLLKGNKIQSLEIY